MALKAKTRLGPYEILSPIGAGGMGEVWRAHDTHLGRDVGIKILTGKFASDPDRQHRFEYEARVMAAVAHPNLIAIYDVGVQDGSTFIVEELLEGVSLRQRIKAGPMTCRSVLDIGVQIARGLSAAHEFGIVHRDLKPENVFITSDGPVKVLDFGLARLIDPPPGQHESLSHLPTLDPEAGILLGTPGYMAPEQVRGEPVDQRADLFSLGIVLYEMFTGTNPFKRSTPLATCGAILTEEPSDLSTQRAEVTPALAQLVARLLEKDPGKRFHSAADVAWALESHGSGMVPTPLPAVPAPVDRAVRRDLLAVAVAAIVLAGGIALAARFRSAATSTSDRKPRIFHIDAHPESVRIGDLLNRRLAVISPDGRKVVFTRKHRLWLRDLDSLTLREIPGTSGGEEPFWSPDSSEIAFWDGIRLKCINTSGGSPTVIGEFARTDPCRCMGGSWSSKGTILVAMVPGGIMRVSAHGGNLEPFMTPDPTAGERDSHEVSFLPDGESSLFVRHVIDNIKTQVWVWHNGQRHRLLEDLPETQDNPCYAPGGFVLYDRVRQGRALMAVPFSLERCEASGPPFIVMEGGGGASVSSDGTLAVVRAPSTRPMELVRLSRQGTVLEAIGESTDYVRYVGISPDGSRVAFTGIQDGEWVIWNMDLKRGARLCISTPGSLNSAPTWSPSGRDLAYGSARNGSSEIVMRREDGSGAQRMIIHADPMNGRVGFPDWSPDGKHLLFFTLQGLKYTTVNGRNPPKLVGEPPGSAATPGDSRLPEPVMAIGPAEISPDGRFVAYATRISGRSEIQVRPFPTGAGPWTISLGGGSSPHWSPRGDELFFLSGNTLMVARVKTTGAFWASKPAVLIDGDRAGVWFYTFMNHYPSYDVAPDGRSFVAVRPTGGKPNELLILENWSTPFRK